MTATFVAIVCVFLGFLCIAGAFVGFMYGKSAVLVGGLLATALVLVTVIPVILAVVLGTTAG